MSWYAYLASEQILLKIWNIADGDLRPRDNILSMCVITNLIEVHYHLVMDMGLAIR